MSERGVVDFEPYVEFPENPFDAARLYLGLLAYPEKGAGLPKGAGCEFTEALWNYVIWQRRRACGLREVRQFLDDPTFKTPRLREFRGKIERARRRIQRRCSAYDIIGNKLVNGILNLRTTAADLISRGLIDDPYLGKKEELFRAPKPEVIRSATPSKHEIIRRNFDRYSSSMGLNRTGVPSDRKQKVRDLVGRGYNQSRSVLHLAHGLNSVIPTAQKDFKFFGEADWILVFLWNADDWVWDAIDAAIAWRSISDLNQYDDLHSSQMTKLYLPKKMQENAPLQD